MEPSNRMIVLIGGVMVLYAIVILSSVGVCIYNSDAVVAGTFKCDGEGRIQKLLEQLMTFISGILAGKYFTGRQP